VQPTPALRVHDSGAWQPEVVRQLTFCGQDPAEAVRRNGNEPATDAKECEKNR